MFLFADKEGKEHYIGVEAGSYHEISYKDGNKNITETYDMDYYSGKTVQYTQGGQTYTENYDEHDSFTGKQVSYKNKQGKTVNEHYNKNNKLSSRNDGTVYEYYANGVLSKKEFGNNVLKYENGKLKSSETQKRGM